MLVLPVEVAAPVAALVSVTVAALVLARDWPRVHARSAGRLVASTRFGVPVGLVVLTSVAPSVVEALLGCTIVAFSLYSLAGDGKWSLAADRLAWLFGFVAGVLGGAYAMNGPPLVIYGALRGWSPAHFRATLQGCFLPASAVVLAATGSPACGRPR